jgi:hypothetical protein
LPLWDAYTRAATDMLQATHARQAPWTVIRSNDKKRARLGAIRSVLARLDYTGKDSALIGRPDHKIVADASFFLTKGGQI